MSSTRIAAVLTVFNRREMTLACLRSLREQEDSADAAIDVFVMDDGSTDGTGEAIREAFPDVTVLPGDGTFFWNGGMRVAMAAARGGDPDYYLWLNDDTTLVPGALSTLLGTVADVGGGPGVPLAVCGAVLDPADGTLAYSGVNAHSRVPTRFDKIDPPVAPVVVQTMNGNCVLLSRAAVASVGNLDPTYTHGMGDYDYGFRLTRNGGTVWLAPGVLGHCVANPGFVSTGDSVRGDLARLRGVKFLPPAEWAHFVREWGGPVWPLFWASPYVRTAVRLTAMKLRTVAARSSRGQGSPSWPVR